jgi:hypothetical protein
VSKRGTAVGESEWNSSKALSVVADFLKKATYGKSIPSVTKNISRGHYDKVASLVQAGAFFDSFS